MTDETGSPNRPADRVGRFLFHLTRGLAVVGGIVVCAMAVLTTVSVSGRASFAAPVPGDIELIALGTSTAVFAFLPYCQLMRGNVIVDFLMSWAPTRARTACDALGSLLYLVIGGILTWRMVLGGVDMYVYAETTSTVGFPRWMTFPYAVLCMAILIAVTVYTLGRSVAETRAGRSPDA